MQNGVYTNAKWQVKEGQLKNVLGILQEMARQSRAEEGNLFYEIYQSNSDSNTIILHEGYKDAAAAEAHRNSPHYQTMVLGQIVPQLDNREVIHTNRII